MAKHILILDDDEIWRVTAESICEMEGCIVALASSGQYVLNAPNLDRFDAIISDTRMEPVDGIAVLKFLEGRGWNKPFLLTSNIGIGPNKESLQQISQDYAFAEFLNKKDYTDGVINFIQRRVA